MNNINEFVEKVSEANKPPTKLVHFFSLTSGETYKVFEDEIKNLDKYQIPL